MKQAPCKGISVDCASQPGCISSPALPATTRIDPPRLHTQRITLTKTPDKIVIDFAGTSAQAKGPINHCGDYSDGVLTAVTGTVGLWHFEEGERSWCCPISTATFTSCPVTSAQDWSSHTSAPQPALQCSRPTAIPSVTDAGSGCTTA